MGDSRVSGDPARLRLTLPLVLIAAGAGVMAGLGVAAFGLTVVGQPLLDLPPEQVQLILVLAPLAGLIPVAALAFAAAQRRAVAARMPVALGLWLAVVAVTTAWFGLRPLLR